MRYYVDTCIWRDFYEDRLGLHGRPLGSIAAKLFLSIMKKKDTILYSDQVTTELSIAYTDEEIRDLIEMAGKLIILEHVSITDDDLVEAKMLKRASLGDALHAILARGHGAVIVTQDAHFDNLRDIVPVFGPEELL